ncbi:hypothetical protein JNUCC64_25685 [Streptomyces sp. JNUCC 64]
MRVTTAERGGVRFDLDDSAATGTTYEIPVRAEPSSSPLATLTYNGHSGVLHSLTLFPAGRLLEGLAGLTSG